MTQQFLYPVLIGLVDFGLAGLLVLVVPLLGVLMAVVGCLVVGTVLFQQLDTSASTPLSQRVRQV